jgi:hypothetical protein
MLDWRTNKGIAMKRIPLATLAAAVSFSGFTLTSAVAQSDPQMNNLHNNLAGMKAGVGLRSEQEPLWNAFQSAVEGVFRSHTPGNQSQSAAERRVISAAGRPLYDSLDDTQKSNFASVGAAPNPRRQACRGFAMEEMLAVILCRPVGIMPKTRKCLRSNRDDGRLARCRLDI